MPTWPGEGSGLGLPGVGQAEPSEPDHEVRGGAGYARGASVFQLVDGADVVRVRTGDLGGELFAVATPAGAKVVPVADVEGNSVVAGLKQAAGSGPALVTVVLAADVRWQVRLSGGAQDEVVDLTGAAGGGDVELVGGTSRAEVLLPAASGTQKVVLAGGASQLLVRVGGQAPVRVSARDGAGSVTVDGQAHPGVSAGAVFAPDGWEMAADRYDIEATAGVSDLTVSRG